MSGGWLAALGLALGLAPAARAQDEEPPQPRPERLYFNPGTLLGSARVVALGGAYVGIAEGAAGFPSNLAALAHRGAALEKDWDLGFTLSWLDLPFTNGRKRDLDNDGRPDESEDSRNLLAGVLLQYKRFGMGFALRNAGVSYCATAACAGESERIRVSLTQSVLAGAVAFGQDDFILALGLYAAQASFRVSSGGDDLRYGDTGVAVDMLYRPHGRSYRVGVTVRPEVVADWNPKEGQSPVLAGRTLFEAVVSPAVLSLGASFRLGEGSERYNRLSPAARRQLVIEGDALPVPEEEARDLPAGRWLISAQVDLISGVDNAVPVRTFAAPAGGGARHGAGDDSSAGGGVRGAVALRGPAAAPACDGGLRGVRAALLGRLGDYGLIRPGAAVHQRGPVGGVLAVMRTALLTVLALVGFAANSLLCRAALAGGGRLIDAASFTGVRLVSGAVVLAVLLRARGGKREGGSWRSALALFAYAAGFSLAYVRIPAGVGALLLFGCVQATMLGTGLVRGERPGAREVAGLLLALGGLVGLTAPGVSAPDPVGGSLVTVDMVSPSSFLCPRPNPWPRRHPAAGR